MVLSAVETTSVSSATISEASEASRSVHLWEEVMRDMTPRLAATHR